MMRSILNASENGLPIYAECGGYVYLMEKLITEKGDFRMCGVFRGCATRQKRINPRFGYISKKLLKDTVLGCAGDKYNAHEFHYYNMSGADEDVCKCEKVSTGELSSGGSVKNRAFGTCDYMYFRGTHGLTERFIAECTR
jgi:cobyrinic acid a,c-diamide synthase